MTEKHTPEPKEWSGGLCPLDPDNCWIDDETGEHVEAMSGKRSQYHRPRHREGKDLENEDHSSY